MRNERTFSVIPCKNLADLQRIIQQTTLWGRWKIPAFSQFDYTSSFSYISIRKLICMNTYLNLRSNI